MARSGDPISYSVDGVVSIIEDTTLNDSDKVIVVPEDEEWEIIGVGVVFTSTATAGNRQIGVELRTAVAGNPLLGAVAGATQAASLTRTYSFAPGLTNLTAFVNGTLGTPLPRLVAGPLQRIRVYDTAAVDAAADDMTVRIQYIKRPL